MVVTKEELKNTEQQNEKSQTTGPASQQQQRGLTRGRTEVRGMSADVFGAGPFTLLRRMTEEMDGAFGEVAGYRGSGGEHIWAPALEMTQLFYRGAQD